MGKIKYLEGLRGVAALIVVLNHLKNICFAGGLANLISHINNLSIPAFLKIFVINAINLCVDGSVAVWIFWVLSSYVLSILFFKEGADYDKVVVGYFSKRYVRLVIPVLASVLFAYILLRLGVMYNLELTAAMGSANGDTWLGSFYNFNADLLKALKCAFFDSFFNNDSGTTYNALLWTIQNEFLGSLFTFGIFGIIRHNKRRYILYFIIMAVALCLNLVWLAAFIAGHILCDYDFSNSDNKILNRLRKLEAKIHAGKIPVLIASIVFIGFYMTIADALQLSPQYRKFWLSIFVVYACSKSPYFKTFFSLKIPVWLGKISFGLYLIHLPLICSLTSFMLLQNDSTMGKMTACLVTLVLSFILAWFFTRYVDQKAVSIANRVGNYFKEHS